MSLGTHFLSTINIKACLVLGLTGGAAFAAGFFIESQHSRWDIHTFDPVSASLLDFRIHSEIMRIGERDPEKINRILYLRINGDLGLIRSVLSGEIGRLSTAGTRKLCGILNGLAERHVQEGYWASVREQFGVLQQHCPGIPTKSADTPDLE